MPAAPVQAPEQQIEAVFVARQPIFDRSEKVWGYELLFRHSAERNSADIQESRVATAKVVADGFILALRGLPAKKRIFINFPGELLLGGTAYALPRDRCVIEILETVPATPQILDACRKLKKAGYTLALDDYFGAPGMAPFLELADIIKVDVLGRSAQDILALTERLSRRGVKLLAEKVENAEVLAMVRGLGYDYFQGFHFSRPEVLSGQKISAGSSSRVRLLSELSREDYEVPSLARIISNDAAVSYRLLQFINSAFFSLPQKIRSIQQAVAILGARPLKQWLMAVILSDLSPTPRAQEICFSSVHRAKLLESLASEKGYAPPRPPESLFLLGLLSRLDVLLGVRMEDILTSLSLDEEIAGALRGEGNRVRPWLDLVVRLESGEFEDARKVLDSLGMNAERAALLQSETASWAHLVLQKAA